MNINKIIACPDCGGRVDFGEVFIDNNECIYCEYCCHYFYVGDGDNEEC
ncbi:hypothetical protein ASwh1_132 [Aeromonas phage Aswh_1]|nr:hypothetical protein ASwh1_132 [Aeromonas phage Aswh_1]